MNIGRLWDKQTEFELATRVPMIIKVPWKSATSAGRHTAASDAHRFALRLSPLLGFAFRALYTCTVVSPRNCRAISKCCTCCAGLGSVLHVFLGSVTQPKQYPFRPHVAQPLTSSVAVVWGNNSQAFVELVDLHPTLASLAGIGFTPPTKLPKAVARSPFFCALVWPVCATLWCSE
jgi:hypothetical protein